MVTLTALADLDSLSLDLHGLAASTALVDGRAASFAQQPAAEDGSGGELVVRLPPELRSGTTHAVTVVHGGVPADLVELGERVSGQQLDELFRVWIDVPAKPTTW